MPGTANPMLDTITVVWPDVDAYARGSEPVSRIDRVTRAEFSERLAGTGIGQAVAGDRSIRVVTLVDEEVLTRWHETEPM